MFAQGAVGDSVVFAQAAALVANALLHRLTARLGRFGVLLAFFVLDHHAGAGDQLFEAVDGAVDIFVVSYFNTDHIFGDILEEVRGTAVH